MIEILFEKGDVYQRLLILMMLYYIFLFARRLFAQRKLFAISAFPHSLGCVFDAATFASSLLLLWGIFNPTILAMIGDTKPFLLIAGVGGMVYSINALIRADAIT